MHLHWIFDIPNYRLSCKINDELTYVAIRGGVGGVEKHYQGTTTVIPYETWRDEFDWLADTYPNMKRAKRDPIDDADYKDIKAKNPYHLLHAAKRYPFGISDDNQILDRLGRPGNVQSNIDNCVLHHVYAVEGVGMFETYDGENFFVRLENPGNDGATYYNMMPCCVFPDNPGVRRATEEEIVKYSLREFVILERASGLVLSNEPPALLTAHYVLP